jgi:hypothetical protein
MSEFQVRMGDFIPSLMQERNLFGKTGRTRLILTSSPAGLVGATSGTLADGAPLSGLYAILNHYSSFVPPGAAPHIHRMAVENADQLRVGVYRPPNLSVGLPTGITGTPPSVRYYFRVRGISEMVNLRNGGVYTFESTATPALQMFCNAYELTGPFSAVSTDLTIEVRFRTLDAVEQQSTNPLTGLGNVFNRIDEDPAAPRPGCYFYDRVISISGFASNQSVSARRVFAWYFNYESFWMGGTLPSGISFADAATGGFTAEQLGDLLRFPGAGPVLFWKNNGFNHDSLFAADGNGPMIPPGGFLSVSSGERVGLDNSHCVEVQFIGALPEVADRPTLIHDLSPPRLLNVFP